jgi:hypothetical protein
MRRPMMFGVTMKIRRILRGVQACLLALMAGGANPLCAQNPPGTNYHETFVSQNVNSHEGYATDGANHYTFDVQAIYKWAGRTNWLLIASNTAPFAGLEGVDHFGDGDYFNGKLYVVAEFWGDCAHFAHQSILVFDAATLARLEAHSVSAQRHEVSGLAVGPQGDQWGVLYVTSYCDGSQIFKYDIRTFDYLGSIQLSRPLSYLQGVAWHDNTFYAPEDGGALYSFHLDGRVSRIYQDTHAGSHEGLKCVDGEIRWLIDEGPGQKRVHYISPDP